MGQPRTVDHEKFESPSFLIWSLGAYGLTIATVILFREYFNLPYLPSISFIVDDGWCMPATDGVGQHCFGDFQDIYAKGVLSPWNWNPTFSHPPLSHAIQYAFGLLGTFSGSKRLALTMWLVFSALVLLIPAVWAMRGSARLQKSAIFVILGLGSLPVLVTLDRGNSIFLLVGLFSGMAWSISRDRLWLAMSFAVCASLIRPQAILMGMAFLAIGRVRMFLLSSALSVLGLLLSFVIYPGDRIGNFLQWTRNLTSYQEYSSVFSDQVPNLSALRAVIYVESLATTTVRGILGGNDLDGTATPVSLLSGVRDLSLLYLGVMTLVTVLAGVLMYSRRGQLSLPALLLIPALLILLVPQTSFMYYASLLLVPFAFMLRPTDFSVPHTTLVAGTRSGMSKTLVAVTSALAVVAFVPFFIPSSLVRGLEVAPSVSLGAHMIGPVALLTLVSLLVALAWSKKPVSSTSDMS